MGVTATRGLNLQKFNEGIKAREEKILDKINSRVDKMSDRVEKYVAKNPEVAADANADFSAFKTAVEQARTTTKATVNSIREQERELISGSDSRETVKPQMLELRKQEKAAVQDMVGLIREAAKAMRSEFGK